MIRETYEEWEERQTREGQAIPRRIREGRFGEYDPSAPTTPDPVALAHEQALTDERVRYYLARQIAAVRDLGRGVFCQRVGRFDHFEMPDAHARTCDCDQGEAFVAAYPKTEDHLRYEAEALESVRRWTRAASDA